MVLRVPMSHLFTYPKCLRSPCVFINCTIQPAAHINSFLFLKRQWPNLRHFLLTLKSWRHREHGSISLWAGDALSHREPSSHFLDLTQPFHSFLSKKASWQHKAPRIENGVGFKIQLHWFKMRQAFGVLIDYWFNMNHVWVLAFKKV